MTISACFQCDTLVKGTRGQSWRLNRMLTLQKVSPERKPNENSNIYSCMCVFTTDPSHSTCVTTRFHSHLNRTSQEKLFLFGSPYWFTVFFLAFFKVKYFQVFLFKQKQKKHFCKLCEINKNWAEGKIHWIKTKHDWGCWLSLIWNRWGKKTLHLKPFHGKSYLQEGLSPSALTAH